MSRIYSTNFEIELNNSDTDGVRCIEIRNPAGSTKRVRILRVMVNSETSYTVASLERYDALATHGSPAPEQEALSQWDPSNPAPSVEVYSSINGSGFTWGGTKDLLYEFALLPNDAGDDAREQPAQYLDQTHQILLEEGTSAALVLRPGGVTTFTVIVVLEEEPAVPVLHINGLLLSGSYSTATYWPIPRGWTSMTFLVAYAAASGSTAARPKARIGWKVGSFEVLQPVVDTTLDLSGSTAQQEQYDAERAPGGTTAATATSKFAIPIDIMPGMREVRLDVAELGDTAHPGTVTVYVTGR